MSEPTPIEATLTASEDQKLSEVEGPAERAAEAHRRVDLYDGLRGVAIVLVVLSHGWQLWPVDWIDSHAAVRPFFRNGNAGVSICPSFDVDRSGTVTINELIQAVNRALIGC